MSISLRNIAVYSALPLALAGAFATPAAADTAAPYTITGHVDLVSRYYLRGQTATYGNVYPGLGNAGADAPEADHPVLQWGVDYSNDSGWYAGYWGSQINYSYKALGKSYDAYVAGQPLPTDYQADKSIENDIYGGYVGKIGDYSYTLGMTGYYYINGKHADALETKLGIGYGDFTIYAQTLLNDTVWGNTGDTYWTLNYGTSLPYDISFSATLGFYTYAKEGKYLGTRDPASGASCPSGQAFIVNGCYAGNLPASSNFRNLTLGITQPIGKTGLVWGLQGILAGKNRFDVQQSNKAVATISYTF